MSEKTLATEEKTREAAKMLLRVGPLGVTSEYFISLGGSPPELLAENPGKTRADLISDEEILKYLIEKKEELEGCLAEETEKPLIAETHILVDRLLLSATIQYLQSIGRLPGEFSDFDEQVKAVP